MILLVAATEAELCGRSGLVCGVGPVEAAAATARALAEERPDAVLHVGLAGGRGLEPGRLVVGTEAVYGDIAAAIPVVSRVEPDPVLLAAVRAALPEALAVPISTSAHVGLCGSEPQSPLALHAAAGAATGGARGSEPRSPRVEGMEGFAVLRSCALAGVPAVELRAVSNELGEEDRSRWDVPLALQALAGALPRVLAAIGE